MSLRKELIKKKIHQERVTNKAALDWVAKNVIIINEKLDRKSVTRLIDSIQKFENTFGPYKEKIPSIGSHLDAAELGLQLIITGKVNPKKTSSNLKQLSYLYSTLSNFFTRDLPILLKTSMFKAAKEQPEQPIASLPSVSQSGVKNDTIVIHDALANAMKPTKEEKKLLGKIYRATKLPKLDFNKISNELTLLSYDDLSKLTVIGKVPMATTPPEEDTEEKIGKTPTAEEGIAEVAEENLAAEGIKKNGLFLYEHSLLTEGLITEATAEELGNALQSVYQVIKRLGLTTLEEPINNLYTKVNKYLSSGAAEKAKQFLSQVKDKKTGLADLFKTPGGNLLKQANMVIETLKSLGNSWPKVKNLLSKPNVSEDDMVDIKKILVKQVDGGIGKKIGSLFQTSPFPGLDTTSIVNALTLGESVAHRKIELLERKLNEASDLVDPNGKTVQSPATNLPPSNNKNNINLDAREVSQSTPVDAKKAMDAARATKVEPEKDMSKGVENLKKSLASLQKFANGALDLEPQQDSGQQDSNIDFSSAADANKPANKIPNIQADNEAEMQQQAQQTPSPDSTEPPDTNNQTQKVSTKSVDYPDIEKKSKEMGVDVEQIESILKWVGITINK